MPIYPPQLTKRGLAREQKLCLVVFICRRVGYHFGALERDSLLGLASRLNSIPNLDNVILAAVATIVSGIVPFCVVVGCVFLAMEFYGSSIRACLQAFYALLSILAVAASYFFGRGLAF